jgi:hypothetical protein
MLKSLAAIVSSASLAVALAPAASAHNAGHFLLPDGTCHEVGSFKEVTRGPNGKLDLIPETPSPFDEYGASYAAFQGNTPILPGPCPR